MPIRQSQAKDEVAVFGEIQKVAWPGIRYFQFKFHAPKDAWLRELKPKTSITIELHERRGPPNVSDVYMAGESQTGGEVRTSIGTINHDETF